MFALIDAFYPLFAAAMLIGIASGWWAFRHRRNPPPDGRA